MLLFLVFIKFFKKKINLIKNEYSIIFIIFCAYISLRSLFVEYDNVLISLKSSLTLIRLFFYVAVICIIENNKFF